MANPGCGNKVTFTIRDFANRLLSEWRDDSVSGPCAVAWKEDEIWGGGRLLGNDSPAYGTRHYILDHLGSPRAVADSLGTFIGSQEFAPFGSGGTSNGGALQFTGHERDAANLGGGQVDLPDYMHARFYSAAGRFLSPDPIVPSAAVHEPQRWNRYAYVANNPMRSADPTGKLLEVRGGTCDDKTPCYSKVDTSQAVQNFVGNDASKYLRLRKNGQVMLKGISAANFIKLGAGAAIIGHLIRSTDRTAAFALSSNVKDDRGNATPAFTKTEAGGTLTEINPAAFPTMMGDATQTLDTAMAHDLGGHALMDMWGVSPLDTAFGSS